VRHGIGGAVGSRGKRLTTVGLIAAGVLAVAVHLGLGGVVVTAAPWVGGVAVAVIGVKVVAVVLVARFAARRRQLAAGASGQPVAVARVPTRRADRYGKQLCAHAAWKAARAEWTSPHGVIDFPDGMGTCRITAEPDHLVLSVEATNPANTARIKDIVGRNIERFAARDGLTVEWTEA
jgi:hypothetical protein